MSGSGLESAVEVEDLVRLCLAFSDGISELCEVWDSVIRNRAKR